MSDKKQISGWLPKPNWWCYSMLILIMSMFLPRISHILKSSQIDSTLLNSQFSELTTKLYPPNPSLRIPALPNGKQWRPRRKVKRWNFEENLDFKTMIDSHVVDLCLFHQWVKCVLFIGTNPTNMLLKHGLKLEPLDFFEDLKGFHFNYFKLWLYKKEGNWRWNHHIDVENPKKWGSWRSKVETWGL